ncbi:MAG: OmpA family protein, partial [Candidatus Cloacimonetes bacterium]|nr:OmpA family protein [Candidatus Cloacimonadota bacterium]
DTRFIFSPLHDKKYAPYLFAGAGASLDMAKGNSDVVPLFPFGLGVELELKKGMDLEVAATYFHSNSDQLDRLTLYDQDTTEKNDGFWGLTAGLTFSDPGPQRKAQPKPVVVEEELEPVPEPVVVTPVVEKPAPVDTRTKDSDQDGLSDYDEANVYMTDPLKADTDGDGLNDGDEIKTHKTDPLRADSDNDGLADGAELLVHKTDPLKSDTDGDGLMDGAEIQDHKTDPLKSDTDGDSLNDALEVNQYKTDPIKADTDGDGLNDGAEVLNHKSDPLKMDTDADGLNDFDEAVQYKTDPLKVDTDGDTLSDYAEVMQHKTNPLVMDTDKGTVDDGTEVAENKDPLDPKDDVLDLRVGSTFSLEGIFFETAKSNILPESIPKLEQAYAALTANPDVKILIVGHTDSDGSEASNMTLSKNRADAVKKWLVDKGIATDRIRTDGKGESQPKATNDTAEGKALNRRIEFVVE